MNVFCDFCKKDLPEADCVAWTGSKNILSVPQRIGVCRDCSKKITYDMLKACIHQVMRNEYK